MIASRSVSGCAVSGLALRVRSHVRCGTGLALRCCVLHRPLAAGPLNAIPAPPSAPQPGADDRPAPDPFLAQQLVRVDVPAVRDHDPGRDGYEIPPAVPRGALAHVGGPAG